MSSSELLNSLGPKLLSGEIEVVDCTGTLGPNTPILQLPADFAKPTPKVEIHKISEYIYFKKRNNIISLILLLSKHAVDYFQRSLINFILFKFKKSFKNFLRLISIFLYITKLYFFIY